MRRLLLVLLLLTASAQAAQNVEPGVFLALQAAQQKGDLAAARRALEGVKGAPGSLGEALLWRSRWAEGDHGRAIERLVQALASGKLDKEAAARERLDLARLNAVEGRDAAVVELLAPLSAKTDEEILPMLAQACQGLGRHDKALPLAERYVQANPKAADSWLRFLVAANADLRRWSAIPTKSANGGNWLPCSRRGAPNTRRWRPCARPIAKACASARANWTTWCC